MHPTARAMFSTGRRRLLVGTAAALAVVGTPAYVAANSSPRWIGPFLSLPLTLVLLVAWPIWRSRDGRSTVRPRSA